MWWLNMEVLVQILDGLAFLLVTPEFLKPETLDLLRSKIVDRTEGRLRNAIALICFAAMAAFGLWWLVQHFYASHKSLFELFHSGLSGIALFLAYYVAAALMLGWCIVPTVYLVLAVSVHVAYQRRMVFVGAGIFFLARILSGWNAVQHSE